MSFQALMHLTATHCCLCRTPLTDAQSIEAGIGPVCSKRYYKCDPPSETSVAYAMGALYKATGIPQDVKTAFFEAAKDCKSAQLVRKGVNVLMYWASSVYQDIPKVLSLVPIVQGLGYWNLGAKLAADRTQAVVEECPEHPGYLRVWMKWKLYRHFKGMVVRFLVDQGAPQKPLGADRAFNYGVKCSERFQKLGGKVGALFRKEDEDLLHKGLSAIFYRDRILWHGTLEVPTPVPYRVWAQALEGHTPVSHEGLKYSIYLRKTMGPFAALGRNAEGPFGPETLMVTTRHHPGFQEELCQQIPLGELRWGRISQAWLIKPEHLRTVLKLMVKHFPPHFTQVTDLDQD